MKYRITLVIVLLILTLCYMPALSRDVLSGIRYEQRDSSVSLQSRLWMFPSAGIDITANAHEFPENIMLLYKLTGGLESIAPYFGVGAKTSDFNVGGFSNSFIITLGLEIDADFIVPGSKGIVSYDIYKGAQDYSVSFLVPLTQLFSGGHRYDNDEVMLLARLISAEARGEPYRGQVAVGAVVMNRVKSREFPNSIYEVIYQQNQFTPVRDGSINASPVPSSVEAAKEALSWVDPTNNALYFYNPKIVSPEGLRFMSTLTETVTIGNHVFLR